MTASQREINDLDGLLKRALADDLPADVEAGMRQRIRTFHAGTMREESRTGAWAWLFRKSAWAVLSILMLIAGILLQSSPSRNALADRISRIKSEISSSVPIDRPV
jgi:hypothetical protein